MQGLRDAAGRAERNRRERTQARVNTHLPVRPWWRLGVTRPNPFFAHVCSSLKLSASLLGTRCEKVKVLLYPIGSCCKTNSPGINEIEPVYNDVKGLYWGWPTHYLCRKSAHGWMRISVLLRKRQFFVWKGHRHRLLCAILQHIIRGWYRVVKIRKKGGNG